jgi:glyoxylase-like metal-dependent hydrolase (beta-lactamase superfamily II)
MKSFQTLILLFFISLNVQCQKNDVTITSKKLTEQVYVLKGQGGNIGLFIGEDAVFMIDDQFAPLTPKILAAIKEITDKPVTYLINTHWHGDHTGGNENMEKEGALIVAHENVRKRMSVDQIIRGKTKKASPKSALPVITFSDDMMLHINNDDILITHVHNSHTDGDAIIYFTKNNVLHMGDAYFQGKFPYIDLNSGGSIDGYISGIEKAVILADVETKIIPGHGNVSSKEEMKPYLKMLKTLRQRLNDEVNNGKSLEDVLKNESITSEYTSYNGWINEERIKTAIYNSLKTTE